MVEEGVVAFGAELGDGLFRGFAVLGHLLGRGLLHVVAGVVADGEGVAGAFAAVDGAGVSEVVWRAADGGGAVWGHEDGGCEGAFVSDLDLVDAFEIGLGGGVGGFWVAAVHDAVDALGLLLEECVGEASDVLDFPEGLIGEGFGVWSGEGDEHDGP